MISYFDILRRLSHGRTCQTCQAPSGLIRVIRIKLRRVAQPAGVRLATLASGFGTHSPLYGLPLGGGVRALFIPNLCQPGFAAAGQRFWPAVAAKQVRAHCKRRALSRFGLCRAGLQSLTHQRTARAPQVSPPVLQHASAAAQYLACSPRPQHTAAAF